MSKNQTAVAIYGIFLRTCMSRLYLGVLLHILLFFISLSNSLLRAMTRILSNIKHTRLNPMYNTTDTSKIPNIIKAANQFIPQT